MTDSVALLRAFDAQARPAEWTSPDPDAVVEEDGPVHRVCRPHRRGFVAGPPSLGVEGADLDDLIARQQAFFAARNQEFEWKTWGHDLPADLPARLIAAGFESEGTETVLIGEAEDLTAPVPLDGITLRETRAEADIEKLVASASEAFGRDVDYLAGYLNDKKHDPDTVVVVAETAEGRVVSSARLEVVPGTEFAGLWGGSTLAEYRGRGVYRALVAHRARVALARGVRYLQVDATEHSRPILERLGFVPVTTTTGHVWKPRSPAAESRVS